MSTSPAPAPAAAPSKNKFLGFVENAGEKVIHAVEDVGKVADDVVKVVESAKELTPAVKASLAVVFDDGQVLATAGLAAFAAKGVNWVADSATVAAVEKFIKDFVAQIPVFKTAIEAITADVK